MSRKMKICMIAVMLFVCAAMADAFAENYATSGNGSDSTCFFVISNGNASVKLRQMEGTCHELSYTHLIDGIQRKNGANTIFMYLCQMAALMSKTGTRHLTGTAIRFISAAPERI